MNEPTRRVALIYNPASGQVSARREAAVREAAGAFRQSGVHVESFETNGPGTGSAEARRCVEAGFDAVIACGGDGTVHEILQALVGTNVALGVLPLGTANALAANLGLTASPVKVAQKLLQATPMRVPVGRIEYQGLDGRPGWRYFVVAAGVGADALLMSRLDSRLKRRLGYVLYLIEGCRIWATDSFPLFEAKMALNGTGNSYKVDVSQLLAVRVRSFGGVLRRLAPGATLHNGYLHVIAFQTRRRLHYLKFLLSVLAGRHTFGSAVQLHESREIECRVRGNPQHPLYVEADGEVLGHLPAKMSVLADALTLLVPPGAEP